MNIAHIVCVFPPYKGGIGNVAYNFGKIAQKNGHSVTIFTPNYNNVTNDYNLNIVRLNPVFKYGNGAFLPQLFFKLKKFNIVYLHYPFFGGAELVWLTKIFNKGKFKLIIHYHMDVNSISMITNILSVPSNLIFNSLFKKADIITSASIDYIKNSKLSKIYQKNKEKFYEVPFGVDTNKFFPLYKKVVQNHINLLFVGGLDRAHYFKGIKVLFRAISYLNFNEWRLIVVGDGELKNDYVKLAKKLKILRNIKFLSGIDNEKLTEIYRNSDLFILSSINKNEAFGIVLLEAMSSGLPVIASDLPGVNSVFTNGKQGFFVEPGNEKDLTEKINRFINNRDELKEMGQNARNLVLTKYNWKKIENKLEYLYKK